MGLRSFVASVSISWAAAGAFGCAGDVSTPFAPGLDPVEATNRASAPAARAGDPYPEEIVVTSGEQDEYAWAHARGYVKAPLAATREAMRDPDVSVDRRAVDEWHVTPDPEKQYDFSYVTHNTVKDVVTVRFDVTWRHGVRAGTREDPEEVIAAFQKTEGTTYISLMRGSIVARKIDAETTELALIEHLKATGKGPEIPEGTMRDYYASVVAKVHGRPLPTYSK